MMNSQFYESHGAVLPARVSTRWAEPVRLPGRGGELRVHSGAVWLTRRGDPQDVVLHAGERLNVRPGDDALFEQWARDVPALVEWHAAPPTGLARLLRRGWALACSALRGKGSSSGSSDVAGDVATHPVR